VTYTVGRAVRARIKDGTAQARKVKVRRMNFGTKVRMLRERKGLTQRELAERSGLTLAGVSQQEQGRRKKLLWESVVRLARALGVSTAAFEDCDEVRFDRRKKPR